MFTTVQVKPLERFSPSGRTCGEEAYSNASKVVKCLGGNFLESINRQDESIIPAAKALPRLSWLNVELGEFVNAADSLKRRTSSRNNGTTLRSRDGFDIKLLKPFDGR